ncbi:hypothetical protein PPACK8108_LOCUS17086 [Phakopsora pachyrhizi]|uniref:Uncharacterized protein n=1 Tax=Phakopsora pachyrhizi TaxID=170000 RepID=A0AAV0B8K3_PHAPC|nr:hypothetical protein PPACK8108_LOCUS17086 [Phakopsora pachyrhizi]
MSPTATGVLEDGDGGGVGGAMARGEIWESSTVTGLASTGLLTKRKEGLGVNSPLKMESPHQLTEEQSPYLKHQVSCAGQGKSTKPANKANEWRPHRSVTRSKDKKPK